MSEAVDAALGAPERALLARQAHALARATRPWQWRECHNPWARSAPLFDSWDMLDLCRKLAHAVRPLLGPDLILFDSGFTPDPWDTGGWRDDAIAFPVEPLAGCTVFVSCGEGATETAAGLATVCALAPGDRYRPHGLAFFARIFPSTARYLRDAGHPRHRALMEHVPLVNAATMPLFLVAGEDRADNDFVTGFNPRAPYWAAPPEL